MKLSKKLLSQAEARRRMYRLDDTLQKEAAAKIEALEADLREHWQIVHHEFCGHNDCVSFNGTRECQAPKPPSLT